MFDHEHATDVVAQTQARLNDVRLIGRHFKLENQVVTLAVLLNRVGHAAVAPLLECRNDSTSNLDCVLDVFLFNCELRSVQVRVQNHVQIVLGHV